MSIDCETANNVIALVNSASTKDEKYRIDLFNKYVDKTYVSDWVKNQDVKLLTLDGTYGGRSGKEFYFLSTDLTAQDDWHIGKKYDMQSFLRYPIVITECGFGIREIHIAKEDEVHNSYLVVSKRMLREKSKNLKRAKTEELEKIANKMVEKFISSFNAMSRSEVYYFIFTRPLNDSCETHIVGDFYGSLISAEEVIRNIPFNDKEFDALIEEVLTFDFEG